MRPPKPHNNNEAYTQKKNCPGILSKDSCHATGSLLEEEEKDHQEEAFAIYQLPLLSFNLRNVSSSLPPPKKKVYNNNNQAGFFFFFFEAI